jgi:hypothetical protein
MDKLPIGRAPSESPELKKSIEELREANRFLEEQRGREITALDDPRVYVLDQYIKQVLEILVRTQVTGLRELITVSGGALNALAAMFAKSLMEKPDDSFFRVVVERLAEAQALKLLFQTGGPYDRGRAGAALRARGMLR